MTKERIEELREEFINSKRCQMCGSQRCERDEVWMEGCPDWYEFLNMHEFKASVKRGLANPNMSPMEKYIAGL